MRSRPPSPPCARSSVAQRSGSTSIRSPRHSAGTAPARPIKPDHRGIGSQRCAAPASASNTTASTTRARCAHLTSQTSRRDETSISTTWSIGTVEATPRVRSGRHDHDEPSSGGSQRHLDVATSDCSSRLRGPRSRPSASPRWCSWCSAGSSVASGSSCSSRSSTPSPTRPEHDRRPGHRQLRRRIGPPRGRCSPCSSASSPSRPW